jgi:ubiquinone/menaquinone biosynthesis C-methylase UbiE
MNHAPTEFDRLDVAYEDAVEDAVRFAGQPHAVYVQAKAQALLRLAERRLQRPPAQALDVGCGIGLTDPLVLPHVGSLHGVDVSEAMVERARERNPDVEYRVYDGSRLPYEDGRFDLVFAICVLHHVGQEARAPFLRELRRVARPDGVIAVFEHNPWNPVTRRVVRACAFDEDVDLLARRRMTNGFEEARIEVTDAAYLLFSPWRSRFIRRLERAVAWLPLGAQYVVAGRPANKL